jgi:hypothetical protein
MKEFFLQRMEYCGEERSIWRNGMVLQICWVVRAVFVTFFLTLHSRLPHTGFDYILCILMRQFNGLAPEYRYYQCSC